jgi:hypothetical protein
MSLSRGEAGAELAAINDVAGRVKQSRIYRVAGDIAIMWGVLQLAGFALKLLAPEQVRIGIGVNALGAALTILMLRRGGAARGGRSARALAAFALFFGFGYVWSHALGDFGPREAAVFWRTLFLFGYCLAGLWFGVGFFAIGAGLTALIFAIYAYAGPQFWPLIWLVTGLGYIVCGLWMRRA